MREAGPVVEAQAPGAAGAQAGALSRPARARRILGVTLGDDAMLAPAAWRVHLAVARDGNDFLVTPPSWRFDIEIEEDLVEELARLHGYDNIPAVAPQGSLMMLPSSEHSRPATATCSRPAAIRRW